MKAIVTDAVVGLIVATGVITLLGAGCYLLFYFISRLN